MLVDEAGEPVGGEAYRVELPNGAIQEGELDEDGFVRLEGLIKGQCRIRFPNVDAFDYAGPPRSVPVAIQAGPVAPSPSPEAGPTAEAAWLELELSDGNGAPQGHAPFRVQSSNGEAPIEGRLDDQGFARVEVPEPGVYRVSFPEHDVQPVGSAT